MGEVLFGIDFYICNVGVFGEFVIGIGNIDVVFIVGIGKLLVKVLVIMCFVLNGEMFNYLLVKDLIL